MITDIKEIQETLKYLLDTAKRRAAIICKVRESTFDDTSFNEFEITANFSESCYGDMEYDSHTFSIEELLDTDESYYEGLKQKEIKAQEEREKTRIIREAENKRNAEKAERETLRKLKAKYEPK